MRRIMDSRAPREDGPIDLDAHEPAAPGESSPPWEPSPPRIVRFRDPEALAEGAARRWLEAAERAVEREGQFLVVLAGGSTPRGLYRRLTESPYRERAPWDRTYFVFGDERCVPADHPESNYRMARESLFDPLGIPELRILRMKGEQNPDEAAQRYEIRLGDLFLVRGRRRFDLVLLGVGADGHTASLFPGSAALDETARWVVANDVPRLGTKRLTLTLPALNATGRVLFLASGEEKAQVVAEAFGGLPHAVPHPVERVRPRLVRCEVLLDEAAAARLPA